MPVTLNATACPAPRNFSGLILLEDGESAGGAAVNARSLALGDDIDGLTKLNRNATQLDLTSRYAAGLYSVGQGLVISAGTGLLVDITAGQAVMDGIVEVPANASIVVSNSIARGYIYLLRDGTFSVVNNSLTPPSEPYVFVGSFVTSGGAVTSVDHSGIMKQYGTLVIRQTADSGAPGDTPGSFAFLTITSGGTYLWNGSSHIPIETSATAIEEAQDAVGSILLDSSTIDFTYSDATPSITASVIDDSISNAKLRNSGALSVIGRSANSSGDPADISASAGSGAVLRESGSALAFGTVATAGIADGAITEAKITLADNTTNNCSASNHGFLKKLSGNAYDVMGGDGNWKPMLLLLQSNRASLTGGALAATITRYCSPTSGVLYETTQANAEIKIPRAGRIKYLRVYVSANAITVGTATVKVMINGSVTSAPNISFTSGTSVGWSVDDSTEINVAAGDLITLELVGATTGSITFTAMLVGLMES